jgi:hypothetical protein
MTEDIIESYETLGVAPGASRAAVKEAYRDLAKVWHPDRFASDERLSRKAQERLTEINSAYERLESYLNEHEGEAASASALPAPRRHVPVNEHPPVAHPFPHLGRTILTAVALLVAFAAIGAIVFLMTEAESRRAGSEQSLQFAEVESRRIRAAAAEAERRAQAEALAVAEKARAAAVFKQKLAERRVRDLEETRREAAASQALTQARKDLDAASADVSEAERQFQAAQKLVRSAGGKGDDAEAFKLLLQAAGRGHPAAQHSLAFMYGSGRGTEKDVVEAYKWFTLAARQGDSAAINNRQAFASQMTPDQIAEGTRRALDLLEKQPDAPTP